MDKGKYVSRSTYQKVVEENKRLKADIRTLVLEEDFSGQWEVWSRWYEHFEKQAQFNKDLREILSYVSPQPPKTS